MTRRRLSQLLVFTLLAALGGCLTLDEPLSDPMTAEPDKDLCGVWQPDQKNEGTNFAFVGVKPGEPGTPQGAMRVTLPGYNPSNQEIESDAPQAAIVSRINGSTYLNVFPTDVNLSTKAGYDAWTAGKDHRVTLFKYAVKGDHLTVWTGLADDAFTKFKASHGITDQASLVQFIKTGGDADLFPPAEKQTYTRFNSR